MRKTYKRKRPHLVWPVALAVSFALVGCSGGLPALPKVSSLNPFAKKEKKLPGKRTAILDKSKTLPAALAPANKPVTLPAPVVNANWSQPGGSANNAPGHLALRTSVKRSWSADAGTGSHYRGRLIVPPIAFDGRVYTLDVSSRLSAFTMGTGKITWRKKLAPDNEHGYEGYGGGLAADGGRLYVATGFGIVYAVNPKTGKQIWEKKIGEPVRTSPTAHRDRLYIMTAAGRLIAMSGLDGTQLWQYRGLPDKATLSASPSPAVSGEYVVAPYSSGELVAVNAATGQPVWTEALSRTRTSSAMGTLNTVARPAIDNGVVYAIGNGGRMIATKLKTGERVWSANIAGNQMPWVSGASVFVVDTTGKLLALDRKTGKILWTVKLAGDNVWSGPVLAGGVLWLVSKGGILTSVDARVGKVLGNSKLGSKAFIAPIVAQSRLMVLTDRAKLIAYN